jgi:hypothetical protein
MHNFDLIGTNMEEWMLTCQFPAERLLRMSFYSHFFFYLVRLLRAFNEKIKGGYVIMNSRLKRRVF